MTKATCKDCGAEYHKVIGSMECPECEGELQEAPRWEDEKTFALAAYQDATCHEKCPSSVVIRLAKFVEQQQARIEEYEILIKEAPEKIRAGVDRDKGNVMRVAIQVLSP